jgi:hypothetical protein
MKQNVGTIRSKSTGIIYTVQWDSEARHAWFRKNGDSAWTLACEDVQSATDAVSCAQRYIDGQPELY